MYVLDKLGTDRAECMPAFEIMRVGVRTRHRVHLCRMTRSGCQKSVMTNGHVPDMIQ